MRKSLLRVATEGFAFAVLLFAADGLQGCRRSEAPMPSRIPPDADIVFRLEVGGAEYRLTPVQVRRFIGIVNRKPHEFEGGKLPLGPYGSFVVGDRVYNWCENFIAMPLPDREGIWLRWDDPVFHQMRSQLLSGQSRPSEQDVRAAMSELN